MTDQQIETSEGKVCQAAVDDYLSPAECYLISLVYLSLPIVLIGDPSYPPFAPDNKTEKLLEKKLTILNVHICTKK